MLLLLCLAATACRASFVRAGEGVLGGMGDLLGEGIDFKGGMLDWEEDDNGRRVAILRNYAVVILPQLTISARNMVLNIELQEVYAEGDVLFDEPSGNSFYCDQLTFNYQEWQGLAKNIRVKVERADVDIPVRDFLDQAPSVSMSSSRSINEVGDPGVGGTGTSQSNIRRIYVRAQELRAHDSQTFELIDAQITPSAFAKPHWYFRSPAALFRGREKIESYHNSVVIGQLPVLYFPYLIRDLQYDWPWMRITGGHTSDYGFFVRSQWGWKLRERENAFFRMNKIIFDLDWFSRRGVGVGLETTYNVGNWESLGKLKVYGVYEYAISKSRDLERAFENNATKIYGWPPGEYPNFEPALYRNKFRWAIDWEHYQQLNELWDVRAEAHLYHDRDYLRDYDPTRYWNEKDPENSINVRRLDRHWSLEFAAQAQLSNKWQTQAEYLPEMRLTVPAYQIGSLPLFLKNDMRVGIVNKRFDEDEFRYSVGRDDGLLALDDATGHSVSRLVDRARYGSFFRAFNEMTLEAPLKVMDLFTFKPWIGLRTAYYQDTLGAPLPDNMLSQADRDARQAGIFTPGQIAGKGPGKTYYAVPFGADLSTRTYTIFGAHDQWRLINEPVVSYRENSRPKLDYERHLYPIDRYDEYYRMRRFGFELHSKLQRRYYEDAPDTDIPQRDILDFNIGFYYYSRRDDRERLNHGSRFSEINTELVFRPTDRLSLSAAVDYDTHDTTINRAIVSADWRLGNLFRARLTHYHYRGHYWAAPDANPSSQTQLAVRSKLWNDSSRYSAEVAIGYEWRKSADWRNSRTGVRHGFNKYRITLFRDLDTFELALSYVRDRNANDHGVFFSLSPKGFMGFDRPPPAYTADVEILADGRYPDAVRYLGSGYRIDAPVMDADLKDVQF